MRTKWVGAAREASVEGVVNKRHLGLCPGLCETGIFNVNDKTN